MTMKKTSESMRLLIMPTIEMGDVKAKTHFVKKQ